MHDGMFEALSQFAVWVTAFTFHVGLGIGRRPELRVQWSATPKVILPGACMSIM